MKWEYCNSYKPIGTFSKGLLQLCVHDKRRLAHQTRS